MHKRTIGGLLAAAALTLIAACGGDDAGSTGTTEPASPAAESGDAVAVQAVDSPLGEILVGEDGMTLYAFTNDVDGVSTCSGACAEAWPAVIVEPGWAAGPDLDSEVFSTVERDDGSKQLVAGKWPLYSYSGDSAPGDLNGQGSGDVWFVVAPDGSLIKEAPADSPAGGADDADGY
jgi:predicted lipoprotein with Yx(FWY)xxD motif